jgi:ElaB/YqjD/DUF883 family membrane-anchored ribosome-binding protein
MNQDNVEGALRSTVGKGEQIAANVLNNGSTAMQGKIDEVAGKAQSAYGSAKDAVGSAKDAVSSGVDAVSSIDLSGLRDEVAKLSQRVGDLVQKQASTTRDQVAGAVNVASENLSQSASMAQEKLTSIESDVEDRIKTNPWVSIGIAAMVGFLIGKMS